MAADETWPNIFRQIPEMTYADIWFGEMTTYPMGRGLTAPRTGWQCPGCSRCLSPAMRECPHCPEAKTAPAVREMGDWEDEK